MLLVGVGVGFSIGRATAPRLAASPRIIQTETTIPVTFAEVTETVEASATDWAEEATESAETTEAEPARPPRPKQTAPTNYAVIDASRVYLRWSKVKDDSGEPVTYAFQIQDRLLGGAYGNTQIIKNLKNTSFSARVLTVRRRWRVWAVNAAGEASKKSPWRSYIRQYVAPAPKKAKSSKKSKNASSTPTSGTAD